MTTAKRQRTPEQRAQEAAHKRAIRARVGAVAAPVAAACQTCAVLAQTVAHLVAMVDGDGRRRTATDGDAAATDAVHNRARRSDLKTLSHDLIEESENAERVSDRATVAAVDGDGTATDGDGRRRGGDAATNSERYVAIDDELTPELADLATTNTTVQDVRSAWLKFCGRNAGKWLHVAGAWQSWCVTWAKNERTERERVAQRDSGTRMRTVDGDSRPKPAPMTEARKRELMPEAFTPYPGGARK